jgi:hypothetical protein
VFGCELVEVLGLDLRRSCGAGASDGQTADNRFTKVNLIRA